jgi:NAD(P)H dehydrogenase (quinone)
MFIVTGATGQLGHAIVEKLIGRVPADQVGVSVREPAKAAEHERMGVRVRHGDFTDPASQRRAFEGGRQLLLVSSNARASGGDTLAQHRAAIEAARAVGIERIVYTSQMAASATSKFPPMHDHAATEELLRASGIGWTALRHGFYASSALMLLGDGPERGVVAAPADGKVAWTAHADLAEADAIFLTNGARHDGPTPPLTGPQALDLAELAAIASQLLGRPVARSVVADDEMRARMLSRGAPAGAVDVMMGLYAASRAGEFTTVDPTLERLLGRRPLDMRAVLAEKLGR